MRAFTTALGVKKVTLVSLAVALGLLIGLNGCGSSQPKVSETQEKAEAKKAEAVEKVTSEAEKKVPQNMTPIEKQGFLTVDSCAKEGAFKDCYLENYICGNDGCYKEFDPGVFGKVQIVLYIHKEGHTYNIETSAVPAEDIDKGINRNEVTVIGSYDKDTNTIYATEFKAPPPPKKSFFKGCL